MHLKTRRQLTVGFISLGCAKNLVDSEVITANVLRGGFGLAGAPEKADIIIVNTCAFITDAKKESIAAIFSACELKRTGRAVFVIVAGCLPQRYRAEIKALLPEVDAFIGVDQLNRVTAVIRRLRQGQRGVLEVSRQARAVFNPPADRILFTAAPYAYLKIAEGCDHHCAFCAIPQIRGKYRSRPLAGIVNEAEALLNRGVRELNLIAQDVTAYGCDLGGQTDLALLLKQLGRLGGRFWIRLLYGHPDHVTRKLLEVMAETQQVCRYLDLPIQHCDGRILRMMGRSGDETSLRKLFAGIRDVLPDIALRTTCLVGFPGETETAFRRLLDFAGEIAFDHLGTFVYSAEEETRAAALPRKVAPATAARRKDALMRRQREIVHRKLTAAIGRVAEIFIEKPAGKMESGGIAAKPMAKHGAFPGQLESLAEPGQASWAGGHRRSGWRSRKYTWQARSRAQAPDIDSVVYFRDDTGKCEPGMLLPARYVRASGYDLEAEPV